MAFANNRTNVEKKGIEMSKNNQWLDKLDLIDPFFGSTEATLKLLETAPTTELRNWLSAQIESNRIFAMRMQLPPKLC